jgi:hypothetical protein
LAADFHGRGVPGSDSGVLLKNYLVVELAVFPPRGEKIRISSSQFRLQVDKKTPVIAASAGEAAWILRMGDDEDPQVQSTVQMGPAVIGIDSRPREERFPGDPMPGGRPRTPQAPRVEGAGKPAEPPHEYVKRMAFPEAGEEVGSRAGMLYFRWKDKITKARTITLLYEGPGGPASLRLK